MLNKKLFEILACPLCKNTVTYNKDSQEIICRHCSVAFPLKDEIPIMLESQARTLTVDERLN